MEISAKLTQMTSKLIQVIGVGVAASTSSALAGDFSADPIPAPASGGGDWCETLQDIGTVYKNKKNPLIQKIKLFGRAQQQWGYVDGDVDGNDFSGDGDELRRLRFGASIEFLDGFKAVGRANFERGGFRDASIRYDGFDELYLQHDFDDVGAFENLKIGYGRYKIGFGGEELTSSKKIKTIERSNLNNYFSGDRSTGTRIQFETNDIDFTFGVYTTDGGSETFGQWEKGEAYHLAAKFKALGGDVTLQGLYNDSNVLEDETLGYEWAVSSSYETEIGDFDLFTNVTYGEDHDGEAIYGVVIMPSTELIEDKLEAVFRYQWFHSEAGGINGTKRYFREVGGDNAVLGALGEDNHTVYAGLNYFICDHNLKLMTGVEHEVNDGGLRDSDSTTLWGAVRFYF